MGEQRPLDALTGFIRAGLPPEGPGKWRFYSRRDIVSGSFESRRFLAPSSGERPQTEFFEYHWAHLMQGNRLSDMVPVFLKMIRRLPPRGLRLPWTLCWLLLAAVGWGILRLGLAFDPDQAVVENLLRIALSAFGAGTLGVLLLFLATRFGPSLLTNSFVDVVRYLDTSPRSYAVRRDIRKGFVELLKGLHESEIGGRPRYDRIVVVAHSLGAYIAYDGINSLWGAQHGRFRPGVTGAPPSLGEFEGAAAALPERGSGPAPDEAALRRYRAAQWRLWGDLRARGNPWRITDFVSCGTPMCFADRLYTKNREDFDQRVARGEIVTCPPLKQADLGPGDGRYTYRVKDADVLNDWSPFAVVRWTNLWFPAVPSFFGIFGDWFGGPLRGLFGNGITDVAVRGNRPWSLVPGFAHAFYFRFPHARGGDSVTRYLADALDLGAPLPGSGRGREDGVEASPVGGLLRALRGRRRP
ncbi:hypothetical protein [Streptomyces sp. NPDC003832]